MKLPGFSAEASLNRTIEGYVFRTSTAEMRRPGPGVIAAFKRQAIAGCGPCMELKWPNGTGTGACMQDCCDLSGNCKFQACTCGGSSVAFGGGNFALSRF
ncbi:MAG TPA: hypothetical protein VGQ72_08085 [Pyrinomonadaceae bacterium]|jgi:hypothetical protein|nr:hypothetical protein [Pyrinomonadaceae bacterium]